MVLESLQTIRYVDGSTLNPTRALNMLENQKRQIGNSGLNVLKHALQADSYKRERKAVKGFEFGVRGAWVLAPSRHGTSCDL